MAQYYQVNSLEDLHRLYPNLQIDNSEGVSCMIQDDQITQFRNRQGQQVITTIKPSSVQMPQNTNIPQQCATQQSQFVVHHPTQYVIQQVEATESQVPAVQYVQHTQQIPQNKKEDAEGQFSDQNLNATIPEFGRDQVQQCIVKEDNSQQFISQVQPIQLQQQSIQIRQQIQAVDMGGNILVLQNQDQQNVLINQNKIQELVPNQNQQENHIQQPQHIIIQRPSQPKTQLTAQRPPTIQKEIVAPQFIQHQIIQNRRASQGGNIPQQQQQQQVISQQQPIIQQLHYYNQVTLIDNYSQQNVQTNEHQPPSNENVGQQQQQQQIHQSPGQQQYRPKKSPQQTNLPIIIQQPQQVLIPQISSPPPLSTRPPQPRKKQDVEGSPASIFILQKVDSPFLLRQPQNKMRFQSPNQKVNEGLYQAAAVQCEPNVETINKNNQQVSQLQSRVSSQTEMQQQTVNMIDGNNKVFSDKSQTPGQFDVGITEQSFVLKTDQGNKPRVAVTQIRPTIVKTKTDQQTETTDIKDMCIQQTEGFVNMIHHQVPSPSSSPSQVHMSPQIQNQFPAAGRGRGVRGAHTPQLPRTGQFVPRARGVQVQTSPPRQPIVEDRRLKTPRGGIRGGRGGFVFSGQDQRQQSPVRAVTPQAVQTTQTPKTGSTDLPAEEARMVVLLFNGEKKIVKIPVSQKNILLGQILQQAGIQIATPTPVAIEQVVDGSVEQLIIKNANSSNQQPGTPLKSIGAVQTVSIPNAGTPRSIVATIHQQRPRGPTPQNPQAPQGVNIVRHRLQLGNSRATSPGSSNLRQEVGSQSSPSGQNSGSAQPAKEEPKFVKGFMAICPFCGISSLDFNKCIRCRRKLPENVKSQSLFHTKKKKVDKSTPDTEKKSEESKSESDEKLDSPDRKEKGSVQGYERKRTKPCLKKKKICDEPGMFNQVPYDEPAEILILSSDDEEDNKTKKTVVCQQALTVLRKEPVYATTEYSETEINKIMNEGNLNEDLMKNAQPGFFTTLQCRTIRVGSYKVQPKERILVSSKGIRLLVNSLKNETATIIIPIANILKVLIHFGKALPVLFIYPLPKVGVQIRNVLGMEDKLGPYYDPTSLDEETHKRITILLEKITEDNKITINKIFGQGKLEEITDKEANEILIRASPVEVRQSLTMPSDMVKKIMVYPPPPEKGGITLNNQDYACLGEDQFLNDVIIDFYLKYLMLKVLSPEDRNRTHVFSTFFYKRLTTKPKTIRKNDPENDPKLSPAEKRHMRVKGWTKQVNLFEKDFIIVPINEHSHWFLAIICFPGLTGPVKFSDNTPVELEEVAPVKKNTQSVQIGNTKITQIIKADGNTLTLEMDSGSDRDEAEGDQDDLHPSSDDEESEQADDESNSSQTVQIPLLAAGSEQQTPLKETKPRPTRKKVTHEPIKQPCILIFDSLAGASRVRVVATLRDYLKIEYKKKMGEERDFSKETIKGAVPKVPQQNNFTDCGLYVLQYVESFFQDPLHDFKLPLKYLQDWFPEEVVSSKRQKLASLIRTLMEEQGIKVDEIGLPVLTFTNENNMDDDQKMEEDEEEEEEDDEEDEDDEDEMNEEEREMLRNRMRLSGFDHANDEEMDLGEEEEAEDEEFDEEEGEEEELVVGGISRTFFVRHRHGSNESESPAKNVGERSSVTSGLVDYPTDSEEEENQETSRTLENTKTEQNSIDVSKERKSQKLQDKIRSVPLTEPEDFESQISCTTIERNVENRNESDMVISEDEEEVGEILDEEEVDHNSTTNRESDKLGQTGERKHVNNDVLVKEKKGVEVTDLLQRLVNDKNITISRKEEELNSISIKKHIELQTCKVKDCDKSELTNPCVSEKNNLASKRSYQDLKSVRIPKKGERQLETSNKKQKLNER